MSSMFNFIATIALSLSFSSFGGSDNVICCSLDENGNNSCTLSGDDGCPSGTKAVVCRYGVWSDAESGAAECIPGW